MRTEITTIIFSKNRACQLELLLRKLTLSATIIYTHDDEFIAGYNKLMEMYPSILFIPQYNLREQIEVMLSEAEEYILFLLDDDVMINPFDENCTEFEEFKTNENIICLNLRMCPRYRYKDRPILENNTWEWFHYRYKRHSRYTTDWGYPMSTSSHIFRTSDIFNILQNDKRPMSIPHHLERAMNQQPVFRRYLMKCFNEAKLISVMANQVQSEYPYPNQGVSPLYLEQEFLKGRRLSFENVQDKASKATGPLMIAGYEWEKE